MYVVNVNCTTGTLSVHEEEESADELQPIYHSSE